MSFPSSKRKQEASSNLQLHHLSSLYTPNTVSNNQYGLDSDAEVQVAKTKEETIFNLKRNNQYLMKKNIEQEIESLQ